MIGVDMIGRIRRAYFDQHRPIKEIVRTLAVSRATVRKVVRGQATEFKYEGGVQPAPKLGEWVEDLTAILEREAKLPRRERRSTQRLFEELRGRGYDGAHDSVHRFAKLWREERARVPARAFVLGRFPDAGPQPGRSPCAGRHPETFTNLAVHDGKPNVCFGAAVKTGRTTRMGAERLARLKCERLLRSTRSFARYARGGSTPATSSIGA